MALVCLAGRDIGSITSPSLFGKGARVRTGPERAAEIEPRRDTSLEYLTTTNQRSRHSESYRPATATGAHRGTVTKMRSMSVELIPGTGPRLLTGALGAIPSTKPPAPLKRTAVPAWRKRGQGGKTVSKLCPRQTGHSLAADMGGHAGLESASAAISVPTLGKDKILINLLF